MIVFDKNALRVWCWVFFFIIQTSSWDGGNCYSMKWCEWGPHAEKLLLWHFLPIKIQCPIFWSCWETVLCSLEWGVFRYLFADMLYDLESICFTIGSCVSILIDLNQEKFSVPIWFKLFGNCLWLQTVLLVSGIVAIWWYIHVPICREKKYCRVWCLWYHCNPVRELDSVETCLWDQFLVQMP